MRQEEAVLLVSVVVLCGGEMLNCGTGESCGSAVDSLLWPCGTEGGQAPGVDARVVTAYPFGLEREPETPRGTASAKSHASLLSSFCGSGVLLASFVCSRNAFCCSKIHIVLTFFLKCNLFEKLQYDSMSKHMINRMCFASFSMIRNNVG